MTTLLTICFAILLFSFFMLFRNNAVFKMRIKLLKENINLHGILPGYFTMLYKFWVPLNRFEAQARDRFEWGEYKCVNCGTNENVKLKVSFALCDKCNVGDLIK